MVYRDTTPAAKYGPTPAYGVCEAGRCGAAARRTCPVCDGEYCLGHAGHEIHEMHAAALDRDAISR
jgi:hypothetical protein